MGWKSFDVVTFDLGSTSNKDSQTAYNAYNFRNLQKMFLVKCALICFYYPLCSSLFYNVVPEFHCHDLASQPP